MRRKRKGTKGDVLIDVTSLLDVMFIILLVVLWGQNRVEDDLKSTQTDATYAKSQAMAEYQLYQDQMELADSLNQYVWAVSVVVPYNENEVTQRQIKLLQEGQEIKSFDLIGNNVSDSVKAFRECLVEYIKENQDRPVILSLNEDDDYILYRDEVMVQEIFNELAGNYSNVYMKGSVGGEEK